MEFKRYEMAIPILDKDYVDQLITALARQGYSVYYNSYANEGECAKVCFTVSSDEVHELNTNNN